MDPDHIKALVELLGEDSRVLVNPQVVERLSRDFYWYSPVLRKQLDGKVADVVVQPLNVTEIQSVLRYCNAHDLSVTARGAGTGNYGQAVPLQRGVVLDLARMDQIEEVQPDGVARCQPGVRLGQLETEARKPDGSCAAIPPPSSRRPWEASSAVDPAVLARLRMARCATSKRFAPSKS